MTRMLYRLGGAAAAHPWRTLGLWLVVVADIEPGEEPEARADALPEEVREPEAVGAR